MRPRRAFSEINASAEPRSNGGGDGYGDPYKGGSYEWNAWLARDAEEQHRDASGDVQEEAYIIENFELNSKKHGVRWRLQASSSEAAKDKDGKSAAFGSVIRGSIFVNQAGERWLRCREKPVNEQGWNEQVRYRFLPFEMEGCTILQPVIPPEEVEDLKPSSAARSPARAQDVRNRASPGQRHEEERSNEVQVRPFVQGSGTLYQVVYKAVALRAKPTPDADILAKLCGDETIELAGWDETRKWRRAWGPVKTPMSGWVMLDHPTLGPLLRPKDLPYSVQPLDPLCMAAREGSIADLRTFVEEGAFVNVKDQNGLTPLMIAAVADHREFCVLLIEAGANALLESPQKLTAAEMSGSEGLSDLIRALTGRHYDPDLLQDTMMRLAPEVMVVADELIERVQSKGQAPSPPRAAVQEPTRNPLQAQQSRQVEQEQPQAQPQHFKEKQEAVTQVPYEVIFESVNVRASPDSESEKVGIRYQGQIIQMLEHDKTGEWRRVLEGDHEDEAGGWMLLEDEDHGTLCRPLWGK